MYTDASGLGLMGFSQPVQGGFNGMMNNYNGLLTNTNYGGMLGNAYNGYNGIANATTLSRPVVGNIGTIGRVGGLAGNGAMQAANAAAANGGLWNGLGNVFKSNGFQGAMGAASLASGIYDIYNSNRTFKENKKSMELQREIARNNLDMSRKEYNRLGNQRKAITSSYNNGVVI